MSIRDGVEWLANTEWSIALHESLYAYAVIESIHVWALCLFVGFAVLLDLRLVGAIFRDVPVSDAVWTKMTALLLAVIFTFTVRRSVAGAPEGRFSSASYKAVGLTSIALWSTVGWGGRWIGFS
jgi:hypothetical protein